MNVTTKNARFEVLAAFFLLSGAGMAAAAQPEIGPAVAVAPQVQETFMQAMPSAAWSEKAHCWLVAWREGEANGLNSDIWCARVSADGKTLDPAGVRVAAAKDAQDLPRVAAGADGFLVVWQDYRNGKDWDVYAARISAEGEALDPDGFAVAGGAHNQCQPDVVFSAGNFYVAWMGFEEPPGFYSIFGAHVSSAGKVVDPPAARHFSGSQSSFALPALAARGEDVFLAARRHVGGYMHEYRYLCVSGASGKAVGKDSVTSGDFRSQGRGGGSGDVHLGFGPQGGLSVYGCMLNFATVLTVDLNAQVNQQPITHLPASSAAQIGKGAINGQQRRSLAWDGTKFLLLMDWASGDGTRGSEVAGWCLTADGKPLKNDPFMVTQGAGCQDQSQIVAGPAGVCLALYRERHGPDDCKVMARRVSVR